VQAGVVLLIQQCVVELLAQRIEFVIDRPTRASYYIASVSRSWRPAGAGFTTPFAGATESKERAEDYREY
jgi:hypothetical protein